MTEPPTSRDAAHFQRLYDQSPDPWGFRTSAYEQAKYRRTLEAIGALRFRSGFEVGCSIGEMTRMLAPCCDRLLGVDIVEQPLADARRACAFQPWVRFERMTVPSEWPDGRFDLIVLSEVLYFLTADDIAATAARVAECLEPNGLVLAVNWRGGEATGDPTTGDEAAALFIWHGAPRLVRIAGHQEAAYRLDVLAGR